MSIAQFIKDMRKRQDLSQKDLAEHLTSRGFEYATSTIGWWETDRAIPPIKDAGFVNALADILHVQPAEIYLAAGYDMAIDGPRNERESRLLAAFRRGDFKELMRIAGED